MSNGKRRNTSRRTPFRPRRPGMGLPETQPSYSSSRPAFSASRNCHPSPGSSCSYQSVAASASSAAAETISSVGIHAHPVRSRKRRFNSSRERVLSSPLSTSARRREISCSHAEAASLSGEPSRVSTRSCTKRARSDSGSARAWSNIFSKSTAAISITNHLARWPFRLRLYLLLFQPAPCPGRRPMRIATVIDHSRQWTIPRRHSQ